MQPAADTPEVARERLRQYKEACGTVDIGVDKADPELANLRLWIKNQKSMHGRWMQGHDVGMTKKKVDVSSYYITPRIFLFAFSESIGSHILTSARAAFRSCFRRRRRRR